MNIREITLFVAVVLNVFSKSFGFVVLVSTPPTTIQTDSSTSLAAAETSRRKWILSTLSPIFLSSLMQGVTPTAATAADGTVDYSKIQDLLGPGGGDYVLPYQVPESGKRPTYLTEPTDEFKESEQKSSEFKRKNLILSKQFQSLLDTITLAPNNEETLIDALDAIRRLVKSNKGLPIGITKEEIIKTCRRRKSKKYWPTSVEVAYQDLVLEISYQQSPNTDRDMTKL